MPREGTGAPNETAREAGARGRRRPPPTIDLPAKDLTPPEDKSAEAAVAEERAAEERAAEEKAAYLHSEAGEGEPPEAEAASGAAAPPPAAPQEPPRRSLGLLSGLVIAVLSGLLGGAIATMIALSFFGPSENIDALTDLEARTVELRQRTDALEARPQPTDSSPVAAALGQRLDTLAATLDGVQGKVTALESAPPQAAASANEAPAAPPPELTARLDALETLARQASTQAGDAANQARDAATQAGNAAAQASSAAERPAASPDAVSALGERIAVLEQRVEAIGKADTSTSANAAALAGLAALRDAVVRGVPFADELAATRKLLGPRGDALQALEANAATGFPNGPALLARFRDSEAGAAAPAKSAAPEPAGEPASDGGIFDRLRRSAESLVSVRRMEEPALPNAEETEAGRALVANALRRDDLAGAAKAIEALPAEARSAAAPVLAEIAARQKAIADIDTLNRQILAGLAGSAP